MSDLSLPPLSLVPLGAEGAPTPPPQARPPGQVPHRPAMPLCEIGTSLLRNASSRLAPGATLSVRCKGPTWISIVRCLGCCL